MSSFIVDDKTINRVLFWLKRTLEGPHFNTWYTETIAEAAELDRREPQFYQKLGVSMAMLNTDAVNYRYQEKGEAEFCYAVAPCTDHQALKSLRCWLYQCTEGDVPERPLYKAFELASLHLALAIVDRSDVYEKCEWA